MTNSICTSCVSDANLIKLITEKGIHIDQCSTCEGKDVIAVDACYDELKNAVRALIRCKFNQQDYIGVNGEKDLVIFFLSNTPLFSNRFYNNAVKAKVILQSISSNYESDPNKGISMICNNGHPSEMFWSVDRLASRKLFDIECEMESKNYIVAIKMIKDIVKDSVKYLTEEVANLELFRARIGFKESKWVGDPAASEPIFRYTPFSKDEIGSPDIKLARKGRMNREGLAFLYLAENADTAIAEVRPSPSDIVSIGKFRQTKTCKIIDFHNIDISKYWQSDNDLEIYYKLYQISKFVSKPTGSSGEHMYIYTQIIAEELLSLGYEGIRFTSSFSKDANYTFFSPNILEYVSKDFKVVKIEGVEVIAEDQHVVERI